MLLLTKSVATLSLFLILETSLVQYVAAQDDGFASGIQLYEEGNLPVAKEFFQAFVQKNPQTATGMYYLGRICFDEENYDEAQKWFEKAVALENTSSEYHLWLGRTYGTQTMNASVLKKPGLAQKTKKHFELAVALDKNNLDAQEELIGYYLRAPGIMGGSTEKAKALAAALKEMDKLRGYRLLGLGYEKEKKHDQAERIYKTAIAEFPDSAITRFQLGYFYLRMERYPEAFEVFEKISATNPDNMNAYFQIGRTGALSGQNLDRAEACLKLYLQHTPSKNNPSLAWAHRWLGMVYEKKGQKNLARDQYEAALKLYPKYKEAKEALKKLK